jgi:dipeptidyl aminopeptidase/acylaminoacyl peptidase
MNLENIDLITNFVKIEFDKIKAKFETVFSALQQEIIIKNFDRIEVSQITYLSNGHKVNGFISKPKTENKTPVIIFNRGGSKDFTIIKKSQFFIGLLAELALSGYTVIASQYSGCAGSEGKDEHGGQELNDILVLKDIIDQLDWVEQSKIGMMGVSRGGLMTYLSLSMVDWIKAAVTWGGRSNMQNLLEKRTEMIEWTKDMFDNTDQNEIDKRSPVKFTEKFCETTPLLIMHGTADWRVDPMDSIELATNLFKNKKPFSLRLFEGADHGLSEFKKLAINSTISWFDRYIKNDEAMPNLEPHGD